MTTAHLAWCITLPGEPLLSDKARLDNLYDLNGTTNGEPKATGGESTAPPGNPGSAAAAQQLLEARFAEMVSISADAIVSVDERHNITLFNRGAESIFGYEAHEVLGKPLSLLIPERFRAAHDQHIRNFATSPVSARQMGERREIFGRRKGGAQFPAEASISRVEVGGSKIFTAVLRDVSARKREEEERLRLLREARSARDEAEDASEKLRFLSDLSADLEGSLDYRESLSVLADRLTSRIADFCVIDMVDDDGSLRRVHHATRLAEWAESVNAFATFEPNRNGSYLLRQTLETRQSTIVGNVDDAFIATMAQSEHHGDLIRNLNSGSCVCVPLVARGNLLGAIALFTHRSRPGFSAADVAFAETICQRAAVSVDNTRLYRQAQRAIAMRDEVLGIVSHDLRNPLSVVSMVSSTLTSGNPLTPDGVKELGSTIRDAAAWMNRLIGDLLDIASIDAGHLSMDRKACDPVVLIMRALTVFEQQVELKSLELSADIPEHLPPVNADPQRALQVLSNLIGNAVKFTESGGRVTVRAAAQNGEVLFSVEDTGRGLDPGDANRVFERFWRKTGTSRVRGTGLGLAISRGIVEAHGGRIWANSEPGRGAVFTFSLPLSAGALRHDESGRS